HLSHLGFPAPLVFLISRGSGFVAVIHNPSRTLVILAPAQRNGGHIRHRPDANIVCHCSTPFKKVFPTHHRSAQPRKSKLCGAVRMITRVPLLKDNATYDKTRRPDLHHASL